MEHKGDILSVKIDKKSKDPIKIIPLFCFSIMSVSSFLWFFKHYIFDNVSYETQIMILEFAFCIFSSRVVYVKLFKKIEN